jgi:hypothetical protein
MENDIIFNTTALPIYEVPEDLSYGSPSGISCDGVNFIFLIPEDDTPPIIHRDEFFF